MVIAAALALSAFGLAAPGPAEAAVQPLTVVASGDSYASGEGAIGSRWVNANCHRSLLAGPRNAADRLDMLRSTSFRSFACSGATTSGLVGQLSTLPSGRIDALTVSIGGNDLRFAPIVRDCITSPPTLAPIVPECTAADSTVTSSLATLSSALTNVFASLPANVTNVFVTEYPDPTTGALGDVPTEVVNG
jgi:hypothetical protein